MQKGSAFPRSVIPDRDRFAACVVAVHVVAKACVSTSLDNPDPIFKRYPVFDNDLCRRHALVSVAVSHLQKTIGHSSADRLLRSVLLCSKGILSPPRVAADDDLVRQKMRETRHQRAATSQPEASPHTRVAGASSVMSTSAPAPTLESAAGTRNVLAPTTRRHKH